VYEEEAALIETALNVATPATADTVVLPHSVAPTGLVPGASVTAPLNVVTTEPLASVAFTTIAG